MSKRVGSLGIIVALLFLALPVSAQPDRIKKIWSPVTTERKISLSPTAVRAIEVKVDLKALQSSDNKTFYLQLPDGLRLKAVKSRESRLDNRGYVWHGKIVGDPMSSVIISTVGKAAMGTIVTTKGKLFRLRTDTEGRQVIEELKPDKFPSEAEPTPIEGKRGRNFEADTCSTDGPGEIDVMAVYTDAARNGAGSKDAMEATILLAVEETNQGYINSNINQRIRLVHMQEVSYAESGSSATDRDALKAKNDGKIDDVHILRDRYAADAVVLITESLDACGRSYIMTSVGNAMEDSAFAVVKRDCATGNFSFGHELGHIMGARHDRYVDPTENSPYSYNHGHTQPNPTLAGTTAWRTVMAYNDACSNAGASCTRILYWTNPNVSWGGDATGVGTGTTQEDNHLALNNTALTVSNFRCSSPGRNDVWMKDTWYDTGAEPDSNQVNMPMWQSPYIWVRNQKDTNLIHQHEHTNPEFGQQNFVYVKIHNGGNAASGDLKVYSADASTGLSWPTNWTLISSVPVNSFAGHSSKIVEVPWNPTGKGHFCLLARWNSSSDPMTTSEGSNIDANVRANNNIVWRNVNIVDLVSDSSDTATFLVRNVSHKEQKISIAIRPSGPQTFTKFGKVALSVDRKLQTKWKDGLIRGEGFVARGNNAILLGQNAKLQSVTLPPGFESPVKITFSRPRTGAYPKDTFYVDVIQTAEEGGKSTVVGGVTYEIHTDRVNK